MNSIFSEDAPYTSRVVEAFLEALSHTIHELPERPRGVGARPTFLLHLEGHLDRSLGPNSPLSEYDRKGLRHLVASLRQEMLLRNRDAT